MLPQSQALFSCSGYFQIKFHAPDFGCASLFFLPYVFSDKRFILKTESSLMNYKLNKN